VGYRQQPAVFAPFVLDRYQPVCETIGRTVRVQLASGNAVEGTADGLDDRGGLVVRTAGALVKVHSGEVVHVRS